LGIRGRGGNERCEEERLTPVTVDMDEFEELGLGEEEDESCKRGKFVPPPVQFADM
jgi:hypothetical protein